MISHSHDSTSTEGSQDFTYKSAMVDTSVIIDGLHTTREHLEGYRALLRSVLYPCTSSYAKKEYLRRLGTQLRLVYNTISKKETLEDAMDWIIHVSSRQKYGYGNNLALGYGIKLQSAIRNKASLRTQRKKALAWVRLQAETLSSTFVERSGLDLQNGSNCHYQSAGPSFKETAGQDKLVWPRIECTPDAIRCEIVSHVRKPPNKKHCNRIHNQIKKLDSPTREQANITEMVHKTRRDVMSLADHKECGKVGDLIIYLDSIGLNNAFTTNLRDWNVFRDTTDVCIFHIKTLVGLKPDELSALE
jgi:hypothetical protein